MLNNPINTLSLIIYENYITPYSKLYTNLDVNLGYEWDNKKIRPKQKRRRHKPTNFKVLYKKLYFLRNKLKTLKRSNWNSLISLNFLKKNSINILESDSYFLRALNNFFLYKKQNASCYKAIKLRGFTFDREEVFNKKIAPITKELIYYNKTIFNTKINIQKQLEKKYKHNYIWVK
jgi:hypothetical protein